jgi:hypothetical protein
VICLKAWVDDIIKALGRLQAKWGLIFMDDGSTRKFIHPRRLQSYGQQYIG